MTGFPGLCSTGILAVFLGAIFFLAGPSDAMARVVRVGAYENPPKIFRALDDSVDGFWADLVEEIAKREEWDVQWVWGSWSDCLQRLAAGRIDIMLDVGFSPARAETYEFSTDPVLLSWTRLYVRQGDARIRTIPDLEGMRIGAMTGSINTDGPGGLRDLVRSFNLACTIIEYTDYNAVFRALEKGELDAGITNRDFGQLKSGDFRVQRTAIIFQPVRLHFAFPKGSAATADLKAAIDSDIHELKDDQGSIYYQLLARYFEAGVTERKVTPGWVAPTLKTSTLAILVIFSAFLVGRLEIRRGRRKLERARLELIDSQERYKEIFNSTGDAIFIHDAETGRLMDINRAMLEMYQCTRDQALSEQMENFSMGKEPYTDKDAAQYLRAAAQGSSQVFEWHARRKDGELFWVEVNLKFAEFGGGRWVIATVRDIEDRKRMEGELIKSAKLQSLGVLAGGIAHDFNNLLTAIMGNVSMAISDVGSENPVIPLLRDIETASQRAQGLTRQLLTFSRGGDPVCKVTRIDAVIRDAAEFVLRGSGTACTFDISEDLWAADVDPGQISQVVQNLVINARQATADQGHIRITCSNLAGGDEPRIRMTVSDDGPGFSDEDLSHAFDPYYTTKSDGNGLGLAICHSIVTKHKGRIVLRLEPSGGAQVVCDLPAVPEGLVEADTVSGHPVVMDLKVLVMDDDEMVRKLAVRMLQHFGCRVVEAVGGAEALETYSAAMAENSPFNLVIMDLTIPGGMGGKETIRHLLELDPQARVIVSSGYSSDPVLAQYRDFGFCAAIVKPYRLAQLNATMIAALE